MPEHPSGMRAFDPRAIGRRECGAWVSYYRRQWGRFLLYAVGREWILKTKPQPSTLRE